VERLAHRILVVVALFVLVVAGILIARGRAVRTEAIGPKPSAADLSINEVALREESASGAHWELTADQASVFDREGRTVLHKVTVRVMDGTRVWTIVGDEGDFFKGTRNLELRRNVVLTSADGMRLETSVLRWQEAERRLWTDAPVRIYRDNAVIDGTAMDVRMADESTTVQGRVRATFSRGSGS
jgi:LPS export ABC transporter protein LptC